MRWNKELALKVQSTARMLNAERKWWETFLKEEHKKRGKWDSMTVEVKQQLALDNWPLTTIDKFKEEKQPLTEEAKRQQEELKNSSRNSTSFLG